MRGLIDTFRSVRHPRDLFPRHPGRRAAGALALVLILTAVALVRTGALEPAPTPAPTPRPPLAIDVEQNGEMAVLSGLDPAVAPGVADQSAAFLKDLYERGFLAPPPAADGVAGAVRPPPEQLVTEAATGPFMAARDAFVSGPDGEVRHGLLHFKGMLFGEGASVQAILLDVRFEGQGNVIVEDGPRPAVFVQQGQVLLLPTPVGWRLGGFDVTLDVQRDAAPAPSPSPQAARWMP